MGIFKNIINYIKRPNVVNRAIRIKEQVGSIPNHLSEIAKKFYRQFPKNKFFTNFVGNKKNTIVSEINDFFGKTTQFFKLGSDSKFRKLGCNIRSISIENGTKIRRMTRIRIKPDKTFMSERVVRSTQDGKLLNCSTRNYEITKTLPVGVKNLLSHNFIDYTKI